MLQFFLFFLLEFTVSVVYSYQKSGDQQQNFSGAMKTATLVLNTKKTKPKTANFN